MTTSIRENLVVETQFATELTLTGLRRLCSVPTDPGLVKWGSSNENYALHVGLSSYSSGLERLCKLAIACAEYVANGKFPELRRYSHKTGQLLDAVEALKVTGQPLTAGVPGASAHELKYLVRPIDDLDPDLIKSVERFASGAGRYEHLDSLWKNDAQVNAYNEWSALAAKALVTTDVRELMSLKGAIEYAVRSELIDDRLESTADGILRDFALPTYDASVGVVLSLFRKARWVSAILSFATYYTSENLPILGEVVSESFLVSTADFFADQIVRTKDAQSVSEELDEVYERISTREAEQADQDLGPIAFRADTSAPKGSVFDTMFP